MSERRRASRGPACPPREDGLPEDTGGEGPSAPERHGPGRAGPLRTGPRAGLRPRGAEIQLLAHAGPVAGRASTPPKVFSRLKARSTRQRSHGSAPRCPHPAGQAAPGSAPPDGRRRSASWGPACGRSCRPGGRRWTTRRTGRSSGRSAGHSSWGSPARTPVLRPSSSSRQGVPPGPGDEAGARVEHGGKAAHAGVAAASGGPVPWPGAICVRPAAPMRDAREDRSPSCREEDTTRRVTPRQARSGP